MLFSLQMICAGCRHDIGSAVMSVATEAYLALIAAKAQQLATDYRNGKLWPGDLSRGLGEIQETIRKIDTSRDQ